MTKALKKKFEAARKSIRGLTLLNGGHESREDGVCAMEAVAWLAGEPHSAAPKCACPALTSYTIRLNDGFNDEERQLLKPYLKKLIGTRDGKALDRARLLAHRAGTVFAPIALEAKGFKDHADILRAVEFGNFIELRDKCRAARAAVLAKYSYDAYAAAAYAAAAYAAALHAAAAYAAYAAYAADVADAASAYAADAAAYAAYAVYADKKKIRALVVKEALKALGDAIKIKEGSK